MCCQLFVFCGCQSSRLTNLGDRLPIRPFQFVRNRVSGIGGSDETQLDETQLNETQLANAEFLSSGIAVGTGSATDTSIATRFRNTQASLTASEARILNQPLASTTTSFDSSNSLADSMSSSGPGNSGVANNTPPQADVVPSRLADRMLRGQVTKDPFSMTNATEMAGPINKAPSSRSLVANTSANTPAAGRRASQSAGEPARLAAKLPANITVAQTSSGQKTVIDLESNPILQRARKREAESAASKTKNTSGKKRVPQVAFSPDNGKPDMLFAYQDVKTSNAKVGAQSESGFDADIESALDAALKSTPPKDAEPDQPNDNDKKVRWNVDDANKNPFGSDESESSTPISDAEENYERMLEELKLNESPSDPAGKSSDQEAITGNGNSRPKPFPGEVIPDYTTDGNAVMPHNEAPGSLPIQMAPEAVVEEWPNNADPYAQPYVESTPFVPYAEPEPYVETVPGNQVVQPPHVYAESQPHETYVETEVSPYQTPMVSPQVQQVTASYPNSCVMDDYQIACAAARHASIANTLEKERTVLQNQQCKDQQRRKKHRRCEAPCASALRQKIMRLQAIDERNKAADQSLRLFYAIAQIDNQMPLIDISLAQLEKNRDRIKALRESGADVPLDATAIDRERNRLLAKQAELRLQRTQASEQLQVLVGPCLCHSQHIIPKVDLMVVENGVYPDQEVQDGLNTRADLALLRTICRCLSDETISVVNKSLSLTQSLLGSSACPPSLCKVGLLLKCNKDEVDCAEINARRQQIQQLLCDLEQQVTSEIRAAAVEVNTRAQMAALAADNVSSWSKRIEDLRELAEIDEATAFDITAAETEKTLAQSKMLESVFNWRLARVKLRAAKGSLATECGYQLPSQNCCCAD